MTEQVYKREYMFRVDDKTAINFKFEPGDLNYDDVMKVSEIASYLYRIGLTSIEFVDLDKIQRLRNS